eukprot:CAMPEP_0206011538 /NCGR_PEP_ID=MMETSP1464-20131121/13392_1 /ASSEMBLY_ACC=CAM_ASM_001124 /TAXON_ID=119497 /ORGANISM="Exanthemachrysis gayraliae, Strain RCC1523" /LENGTH=209 /DNA_ID=CAMNT_0053385207 /DNA_START=298 /DNA_END=925 /DNA_ORIENTATION=-
MSWLVRPVLDGPNRGDVVAHVQRVTLHGDHLPPAEPAGAEKVLAAHPEVRIPVLAEVVHLGLALWAPVGGGLARVHAAHVLVQEVSIGVALVAPRARAVGAARPLARLGDAIQRACGQKGCGQHARRDSRRLRFPVEARCSRREPGEKEAWDLRGALRHPHPALGVARERGEGQWPARPVRAVRRGPRALTAGQLGGQRRWVAQHGVHR